VVEILDMAGCTAVDPNGRPRPEEERLSQRPHVTGGTSPCGVDERIPRHCDPDVDSEVEDLRRRLERADGVIHDLHDSLSWRLTTPLRRAKPAARRVRPQKT
jgi:hypothetical protein